MRYSFPQPGNEDEFEEFCVRFYRLWLKRDGLIRYGKRGEKQDGIDIIDQANQKPLVAIQCKQHEQGKRISKKDIQDEVALAEASLHPIERYIIATTARKSRTAQDTVVELNGREDASRRFEVLIHFWEDICAWLGEFERAVLDYVLYGERHDQQSLASITWGPGTRSAATADSETGDEGTELYPEIDVLFKNRKLEAAEHEINKLPDPEQDSTLSKQRRYAILRLRAKLALERLHYDEAARLFMLAYHTSPELQQARQNRVLSL